MVGAAPHTCWDAPGWDGTISAVGECSGCEQAAAHPCRWCGYGHVFTTHNPDAHLDPDDGVVDPLVPEAVFGAGADPATRAIVDAWLCGAHLYQEVG